MNMHEIAKENLMRPLFGPSSLRSSPGALGGTALKCGSMFSLWA